MVEQALECLRIADTFTAIEFLNQQPSPLAVAAAYDELIKELYWQERNLDQVVALSRAGIQYCSDQAQAAAADREESYALRSAAKRLAYNLASFTWPGWNEADLKPGAQQAQNGLDAARLNLRLALELDKGDLPLSRAYWMLGAHLMAAGALTGAAANFRRAAMYARRAAVAAEALLCEAFAALADLLVAGGKKGAESTYQVAKEALLGTEDGALFAEQLEGARAVFAAR